MSLIKPLTKVITSFAKQETVCQAHQHMRKNCSVSQNILKKYRLVNFARSVGLPLFTALNGQTGHSHANALDSNTKDLVLEFYEREDNSRLTSGKKQTATINKVKKQKRWLLDTIVNLHEKFCAEYARNCISYATFGRLCPFSVRLPTSKDRDTCMCKKACKCSADVRQTVSAWCG